MNGKEAIGQPVQGGKDGQGHRSPGVRRSGEDSAPGQLRRIVREELDRWRAAMIDILRQSYFFAVYFLPFVWNFGKLGYLINITFAPYRSSLSI